MLKHWKGPCNSSDGQDCSSSGETQLEVLMKSRVCRRSTGNHSPRLSDTADADQSVFLMLSPITHVSAMFNPSRSSCHCGCASSTDEQPAAPPGTDAGKFIGTTDPEPRKIELLTCERALLNACEPTVGILFKLWAFERRGTLPVLICLLIYFTLVWTLFQLSKTRRLLSERGLCSASPCKCTDLTFQTSTTFPFISIIIPS